MGAGVSAFGVALLVIERVFHSLKTHHNHKQWDAPRRRSAALLGVVVKSLGVDNAFNSKQ
jgi:hypothetical protein